MILAALVEAFVQGTGLDVAVFLACKKKNERSPSERAISLRRGHSLSFFVPDA